MAEIGNQDEAFKSTIARVQKLRIKNKAIKQNWIDRIEQHVVDDLLYTGGKWVLGVKDTNGIIKLKDAFENQDTIEETITRFLSLEYGEQEDEKAIRVELLQPLADIIASTNIHTQELDAYKKKPAFNLVLEFLAHNLQPVQSTPTFGLAKKSYKIATSLPEPKRKNKKKDPKGKELSSETDTSSDLSE